jgi:hypothetical protein
LMKNSIDLLKHFDYLMKNSIDLMKHVDTFDETFRPKFTDKNQIGNYKFTTICFLAYLCLCFLRVNLAPGGELWTLGGEHTTL